MSAKELIELAAKHGYAVGRNKPGIYRYAKTENGAHIERDFYGTWAEFCAFFKKLCI